MKAIILAAGYATRLYPLTKDKPKPLLDIAGKTIIEYLLDDFRKIYALDTVYVVTNAKFAPVFETWAEKQEHREHPFPFQIVIVNDGTTSNETRLGAIADIQFVIEKHNIDDDLLVAAGDNIFQFDFTDLAKFYSTMDSDIIVAQELNDPERLKTRGVVQFDENKRVIGFQEKPAEPKSKFVAPALYIHKRDSIKFYFEYLNFQNNPDAPGYFIKWLYPQTAVHAFVMPKPAIDIGTLERYERVCREFESA
jgi:glucose-1-phosphate thymidylyltransferase